MRDLVYRIGKLRPQIDVYIESATQTGAAANHLADGVGEAYLLALRMLSIAVPREQRARVSQIPGDLRVLDRDLARFLARDALTQFAGLLPDDSRKRGGAGVNGRLRDTARDLLSGLQGPLGEFSRQRERVVEHARAFRIVRFEPPSPAAQLLALAAYGFVALAVTPLRNPDRADDRADDGQSRLERVPTLDDSERLQVTTEAVEALLAAVAPFAEEGATALEPDEWANLDVALRALQGQLRAPTKNPVIISAAFADVLRVVKPYLGENEAPSANEQAAATIIAGASLMSTDDDHEFGDIAQSVIAAAAVEAEAAQPSLAGLARRGVRSSIEPSFAKLTEHLILGIPGALATGGGHDRLDRRVRQLGQRRWWCCGNREHRCALRRRHHTTTADLNTGWLP